MKNKYITLYPIIVIFQILKEAFTYNESVPFNFTQTPNYCYQEDFILSKEYRPFVDDIYPIRGCSSDERNRNYQNNNSGYQLRLVNITFEPSLDYFFNKDVYPPSDRDPPTSMTFKIISISPLFDAYSRGSHYNLIAFGRSEDYHPIPKISKKTGKPIQYIGNYAILPARAKIVPVQFQETTDYNFSYSDYEIYDYEGYDFNAYFDGYILNLSSSFDSYRDYKCSNDFHYMCALIVKVYDLPRMKVQGLFQFNCSISTYPYNPNTRKLDSIYTVDTRNVFFQNISMFYNQRVNVTNEGLEPTGEDSGFWVKTPCNTHQMATIMVDYHFFDTIHRMQSYGFEFSDRFQLRIHTPYYRKTLTTSYSLFRSQYNKTMPPPRVFIHPISKYKEYCETYKNCTKFDYDEWSTDPKFTKYIIDIKNQIVDNEIWINFTELEKIYEADGFHRGKLVINVNNTMTPHITQIANGLWAELYDTLTNDWVMKTKTNMDEVHGYIDDYEPDPYRNFYLTCEIPDNITTDDLDFYIKKYGILQKAHLWFRLDIYNKGVMKMYPPRVNTVIKFPPEIILNNESFVYTYQYYIGYNDYWKNNHWVLKDLRQTGIGDGTITNDTFDLERNILNVSELHPNIVSGEDYMFYYIYYMYVCYLYFDEFGNTCFNISTRRYFLYYVYELNLMYNTNNTGPIDITVYHVKYIPYHSKNQINRGLHRWNQHHAGWDVPAAALFDARAPEIYGKIRRKSYKNYRITDFDNYYYWNGTGYYNLYGYSYIDKYTGPDCVFDHDGGSTLRNRSCEFWAGIIPDKPFTNYARDIVEEHIAYRTLNDNSFKINTSQIAEGFICRTKSFCPFSGKHTSFFFEIGYFSPGVGRDYEDGEVICIYFYVTPKECLRYLGNMSSQNIHIPLINIHKYPEEFFLRLDLPKNLTVQAEVVGQILPCVRFNPTLADPWIGEHKTDYMCYYLNSSTIYAFNSVTQVGWGTNSVHFDINIWIDYLYYHENTPRLEYYSGLLRWGFYDDPFFYKRFPKPNDTLNYLDFKNATVRFTRDNVTNDGMATLNISLLFKDCFYKDQIFKFYFGKEINYIECLNIYFDNKIENYNELKKFAEEKRGRITYWTISHGDINDWDYEAEATYYKTPEDSNIFYYIMPYARDFAMSRDVFYKNTITEGEIFQIDITFKIINPRSFKTTRFYFYDFNTDYVCSIQGDQFNFTNTIPQYLYNMTVTPNSYFTGDRAIYKFNYITYMRETLIGDVFEFKTSWKTKYTDNEEDPDENGYYINRIIIDQYYNSSEDTNLTLIANFILNPETLETQYIKDIHMYDSEGYLLSVCNDTIPIKMRKISGFKRSEVSTEKTEDDNKFDISFEMVPEILIRKNDKLRLKFSSMVSLDEYTECKIDSTKGLSILDPDFKCEIDKDNNELILHNAFKEIGESLQIFEYLNSTALTDQQFIFSLKDIPIYSKSNDLENVYAIEIQTENDNGLITQTNLLPSTAIFKCDSRCKTCNEQSPSECLSCNKDYPYFYPNEKYCHKFCPKEKYYIKQNENGNTECLMCEEPCEKCVGTATNCTFCLENYFMDNKTCVKDCSEGKEKDFILRRCYPITKRNLTVFIDRIIQVNVSVPELYPVYIERNVCMIGGSDIFQN